MATILVIDDNNEFRTMLRDILVIAGYSVIEAEDGEIGLQLYRDETPDLIITDLIMPNKEGIELIMELKSEFPEAKIIAISGGGQRAEPSVFLLAAKKLGAMCVLRKPFEREKLLTSVEECLSS